MIIIKKRKDIIGYDVSTNNAESTIMNLIDHTIQREAINPIRDMLNNRSKCLLYTKSENKYVRFIVKFLIQNKDISKYEYIELMNMYGSNIFIKAFDENGSIIDRFVFVD